MEFLTAVKITLSRQIGNFWRKYEYQPLWGEMYAVEEVCSSVNQTTDFQHHVHRTGTKFSLFDKNLPIVAVNLPWASWSFFRFL